MSCISCQLTYLYRVQSIGILIVFDLYKQCTLHKEKRTFLSLQMLLLFLIFHCIESWLEICKCLLLNYHFCKNVLVESILRILYILNILQPKFLLYPARKNQILNICRSCITLQRNISAMSADPRVQSSDTRLNKGSRRLR